MRTRSLGFLVVAVVLLSSCASNAEEGPLPTVTVTAVIAATPSPAVTLTREIERPPDAALTELEAFAICSSAGIGAMRESLAGDYTQVRPLDPGDVVDHDDGSFTVTVAMVVTDAQPVLIDCDVTGSMGDPRVEITDISFVD